MPNLDSPAPRVSVLMAVYNAADYLASAVESILSQTFTDFEFVIIDDGSTDNSAEILSQFSDDRIRLLTNERNLGLTPSLNRGLAVARGTYIARQDADDLSASSRLGQQVGFLDAHPQASMVGCSWQRIAADGAPLDMVAAIVDPVRLRDRVIVETGFAHGSVMMRAERVSAVGGYREKVGPAEDLDLWLRLAERGELGNLAQPLYQLRVHADSIVSSNLQRHLEAVYGVRKAALARWQDAPPAFELTSRTLAETNTLLACQDVVMARGAAAKTHLAHSAETDLNWLYSEAFQATVAAYALWACKIHAPFATPERWRDLGRVFIEALLARLPASITIEARPIVARFLSAAAFDASATQHSAEITPFALRSMLADPRSVANVGLWRLMGQSVRQRVSKE